MKRTEKLDVPLGAILTNPALYRNFRLVLNEVIWKSQSLSSKLSTTYICWEFRHQLAPLALVRNLATGWRHMHCHIAWVGISLLASSVSINFVFSSIRVKSARSSSWSSTRVINQDLQLGSSTRIINWVRQLGFHQLVFISQVFTTLTTLTVFTRSSQGFKNLSQRKKERQRGRPNDRTQCAHGSPKK